MAPYSRRIRRARGGFGTAAELGFVRSAKARLISAIAALGNQSGDTEIGLASTEAGCVESFLVKITEKNMGAGADFEYVFTDAA
jgi:hypothetical protein